MAISLTAKLQAQEPAIRLPNGQPAMPATPVTAPAVDAAKETVLKHLFAKVDASLVIDLFDSSTVLDGIDELPNDANCLWRLAKSNSRQLRFVSGGYALYREPVGQGGIVPGQTDEQIYGWLDKLQSQNPDQFRALLSGGADLEDLDQEGQEMFGGLMAAWGGAGKGLVSGTPINVSLTLCPRLFRDGSDVSGRATSYALISSANRRRPAPGTGRVHDVSPFVAASDGDLDFGNGQLLPLVELCTRAGAKFDFGAQCDARARKDLMFVKGRFTKDRIMATLQLIGAGGPTVVLKPSMSRGALRRLIVKVLREALDADPGDPRASYLRSALDDLKSIDAGMLGQFGYSKGQIASSTSVSVMAGITVQSDIAQVSMGDGIVRVMPRKSTLGLGGS